MIAQQLKKNSWFIYLKMLINLLLLVSGVYGAAIPPQPQIPTTSQCLRDCFEVGSLVNAAFDLTNFKSIAVDIENFCRINSALLKCGRECPEEQMAELEARTQASSFACSEKVEEFRLVSECLDSAPDVVEKCSSDCRFSSDHTPIRLDSSPAALVNPTVLLDGIGDTCQKHMCIVKCSIAGFNKACSGSGDLFKDVARQQVVMGEQRLMADSSNENQTTVQMMTLNYLHNLPKECVFMKDSKAYDKAVQNSESDENTGSEMTTVSIAVENEKDFMDKSTPAEGETDVTTQDTTKEHKSKITTSSMFEFEPNNDPEVPVGPPEVGATVEPTHAVEGPAETDEEIIDSEGRTTTKKTSIVDSSASMATEESAEETTTESVAEEEPLEMLDTIAEGTTEMTRGDDKFTKDMIDEKKTSDEMSNEVDTTTSSQEPVIVIEDSARKEGENDIVAGGVEEVKSTNYVPAAAFLPSLAAVIAFILCL